MAVVYSEAHLAEDFDEALDDFCRIVYFEDKIAADLKQELQSICDNWFWFEERLDDGKLVADHVLDTFSDMSAGERLYLEAMSHSSQRLYEVVDKRPGLELTLRDLLSDTKVVVHERQGSHTMVRGTWLLARVGPPGPSGKPMLEPGVLEVPLLWHSWSWFLRDIRDHLATMASDLEAMDERGRAAELSCLLCDAWIEGAGNGSSPVLANTDREPLLFTTNHFEVLDRERLAAALRYHPEFDAEEEADGAWYWLAGDDGNGRTSLGDLRIQGGTAEFKTNSAERGERGRALLEELCPGALKLRATSHVDPMSAKATEESDTAPPSKAEPEDPEVAQAMAAFVNDMYARHYRSWIDLPVPALNGLTPRQAAKKPALRAEVTALIQGIRQMYEASLLRGEPSYDPWWMWAELGLADPHAPQGPPPLAHDRWDSAVPNLLQVARTVAERLRSEPGRDGPEAALAASELDSDLAVRRFLGECARGAHAASTAAWLACAAKLEFGRRKVFGVVPELAFLLGQTDLSAQGHEVRAPFPFFALVFTDRGTLALAERWLVARRDSPIAGQIIRVLTVYVAEHPTADGRSLQISFAPDALGAAPPPLLEHTLALIDNQPLELGAAAPVRIESAGVVRAVPVVVPLAGLLHRVISAILYATSVDAETRAAPSPVSRGLPDQRAAPGSKKGRPVDHAAVLPRDAEQGPKTFVLPGTIDISRVRALQEVERAPGGVGLLHRFLVRGHWRRPNAGWADQRLRWIAPYWKGPELADVIERAYRMKP